MKSNKFTIEESSNGGGISNEKKSCAICGTSKTPLWRSGPAGPKSLCNACGIRNRKKRRTVIRLMELGREVMLQRSTAENQRLGEEEQAAVLLMALSYASSVYA
ncbi:unnamed protein product [Arabis nemorensis]|uniref:GATA-type domain-containing protein n=1 Tax=Arabis nemorensis TaxID=586526 RepID=A0A565B5X6_9BRAS|nr:unnamed protein product [Arabis nemorensis]